MIESVHQGHMGTQKCISRARDVMFWPGMTQQITNFVLACPICNKYRRSNTKEPLTPHEIPQRPWQNIAVDLFSFDGNDYLVTTDYYSRFFEVDTLPNTQSITIIRKLKVHFARYGICEKLVSDNGPQLSLALFADFANEWGFSHQTSSPLHPASNGLAEKTVSIVKRLFQKAKESKKDPYIAILGYRNTPLDCGYSPCQLLMGRRTRSILPITNKQLEPKTINPEEVRDKIQKAKKKQKGYYDRQTKPLPPLLINEYVRVQMGKIWKPAKVIEKHDDHSYSVQTQDGAIYRRNRRVLNKTKERFPDITEFAPNILAGTSKFSTEINNPCGTSTENADHSNVPSLPRLHSQTPYVTRSGREIKPNRQYANENWITDSK
ncbi:uncharacterized protein K02A2.6-like [Mercenaria mercenaria]|uniref:uncharacterized protein K02A2.6-like n=1 Tax=Mercenaria mercenaria TaxID=6596 RepID=UPI00234FA2DA|nr:uncharacterized protein K02A2.6-like [Mercenaria mercenaria]